MFVTEIRDSNDLLAAIGEKIVIYFHRLIFILLYAYMFMFKVGSANVSHPFLWRVFTSEFFLISCPAFLLSGILKISLGTDKNNIIKNVVAENKIIGLLTIIGFMAIYMLYTRSLFIAQGIIIGVFWLIKMLIGYRIKVRKSELESGEIKSDRKEKIIFIAVAVFILMVQMHQ